MRRIIGRHPLGIWVALFCMLFCVLAGCGGQAISLLSWDLALRLHLQESNPNSAEIVQRVLAQVEWGVCVADTFLVLPLFCLGLLGILLRRRWGQVAGLMAAICWVYMFAAYAAQRYAVIVRAGMGRWSDCAGILAAFAVAALAPCVLIIWGLAANADRFAIPSPHSHMLRRKQDRLEPFFLGELLICAGQVLRVIPQVWIGKRLAWNTRPEEQARKLTGDAMVQCPTVVQRAITIDRPPEKVWPWVARLGRGAAYYSWDFLDNPGHRHADDLLGVPEPLVGDWNKDIGAVRHVETGRELVWRDEPEFFGMKAPVAMTFRLDAEPGDATRLEFRISWGLAQTSLKARLALRVGLLMDQVMSTEMLRRLKLLIETYESRLDNGETNRSLAPHQRAAWGRAGEAEAAKRLEQDPSDTIFHSTRPESSAEG